MSRAVAFVTRLGDAVDALAGWVRATPPQVRAALATRRYRRIGIATALGYLVLYLIAIQDIEISGSGRFGRFADIPSADLVANWTDRLFAARAPFLYEPIGTVYLLPQLAFFVSPGNLLVGSALGVLLGMNIAVALHAGAKQRACRRGRYASVLGALPGLLMGFGCCAPTFILMLGTGATAAVLPVFIPLREYLFPGAIAAMTVMVVWASRRSALADRM